MVILYIDQDAEFRKIYITINHNLSFHNHHFKKDCQVTIKINVFAVARTFGLVFIKYQITGMTSSPRSTGKSPSKPHNLIQT